MRKQRSGASALLEQVEVPAEATQLLVHVRDYTKGHPRIEANNHPVRHGAVVGVHNGIIVNDEEIFAAHGFERAEPEMTVDSEAIFALAEKADADARVLEQLRGSMATAWLDERRPDIVFLARGVGRPLWLGRGSTSSSSRRRGRRSRSSRPRCAMTLTKREVAEGTLLALRGRPRRLRRALHARPLARGDAAAGRARAARGRLVPAQLAAILAATA